MKQTTTTKGGKVTVDKTNLDLLRAELAKHQGAAVQIGVIGNTQRFEEFGDTTLNNAELGLIHEFGVIGHVSSHKSRNAVRKERAKFDQFRNETTIPERSFLRMPLITELPAAIYKIGKEYWRKMIAGKGLIYGLKQLGILGEATVQEAFNTGGFGQWPALKKSTIRRKGSSAILIDTAQLRQSVTSRVVTAK